MTTLHEIGKLGQSIWYDNIRRALLDHGEMQKLIDAGVVGVTSNPTIFEKAIVGSADYDEQLRSLSADMPVGEVYEALAIEDIRRTADLLKPVFESTNGLDGYVSLEVSPTLANDTKGTINEAKRLFATVDRPNVMIKIPGTPAGVPAIKAAIAAGLNINVTLLFSLSQYEAVIEAYIAGLEELDASGGNVSTIASVASFFVSRVDGLVDKALDQIGNSELQGKIAIANAKIAYALFKERFGSSRWQALAAKGAQVQRPLWASTSTKNPLYPDTLYVDTLIGPQTVNTMPPATVNAVLDHGTPALTLESGADEARDQIARLHDLGINFHDVTEQLQSDGVASFIKSFESLMNGVAEKREHLLAEQQGYVASLGEYQASVDQALAELRDHDVMRRMWAHDHTIWKPEPTEITNRLGWLHSPEVMAEPIEDINNLVETLRGEGYTNALLLGMGGSSLAPELFRLTFGVKEGYLDLAVLDNTDPGAVLTYANQLDMATTVFVVSTKSGGTVETFSFFKFFYNKVVEAVGPDQAGNHFVAITDPGSGLVDTASKYRFRKVFLNDPNIGGRYSALSFFGLVPAAMVGVDLPTLLDRAQTMASNCDSPNCPASGDNSGAWLGAVMGELAAAGRDKLTLFTSPQLAAFGAWAEQLIAESTGKEGKGILPVADEPPAAPGLYGSDRLFVYLRLANDTTYDAALQALRDAGQPTIQINLKDIYDLGGEFMRWEIATAVSGQRLKINPFDQPNVESAKVLARQMVAAYKEAGKLPELTATLTDGQITVYGDVSADSAPAALNAFLAQRQPGDYISIQAYVPMNADTIETLQSLRTKLRDSTHLATTVGFGPRFLHSTGQLHKGDSGNGLFIQFTSDKPQDADIPDEAGNQASGMSFGVLQMAQALGDRQALLDAQPQRRVLRLHLSGPVDATIQQLEAGLA